MRRTLIVMSALALLLIAAAPAATAGAAGPKPQYSLDRTELPFDAMDGATAYWGVHGGAGYRIEVPDNWNGQLVMWAHGFRSSNELTVDNHPLRDLLVPNGYAWAASSYSKNDYNIATGVKDTHNLLKKFNGLVGKPDQVYITGASMGGHITAVSIEQFPKSYDGALAVCGVLGDYELFDYFLDFNLAAQQLGTGSSQYPVDPAQYLGLTVPAIKANLSGPGPGWPLSLSPDGENLKSLTELRSGGDRPNFDEAWFFWNSFPSFASTPGNFLFDLAIGDGTLPGSPGFALDNADVVYQFDGDAALSAEEAAFNDAIFRVSPDSSGRHPNGLAQVPVISGDIEVPIMTLHNLGDLFVPVHNEIEYAERVAAQGNSDLLVQRAIRGVGHCDFTEFEFGGAFLELVAWVDFGIKPAGDDWTDPAAVADPNFGCAFTVDPFDEHILATPCP